MNKFQFAVTIFLLCIALILLLTDKGSGIATTIITAVCAFWLSKDRSR